MSYELLNSEVLYPGRAFTIRRDQIRLPNGQTTKLDIVEHIGSVVIIPVDAGGNILFVRQYRHATGLSLLELPAGTLEENEQPDVCARREIREETGMAARKMVEIGSFYLAPGYSTEYMHVYLATELYPAPLEADADEFLQLEAIPVDQVLEMSRQGKLPDAKSLAALYLALPHLV
jgi:ADP-ribose pyrophosphatase